jgi:hypothetical protein
MGRYRDASSEPSGSAGAGRVAPGHDGPMTWRQQRALRRAPVRPQDVRRELRSLLGVDDLAGVGWRVLDERAWGTGHGDVEAEWADRAREAGLITVWRSFEQAASGRWLWVQLTRLCSPDDALQALADAPERFVRNPRARVDVVAERTVKPPRLEGADATWAYEQRTTGRRGRGIARYLGIAKGDALVVLLASGHGNAWPAVDLQQIAQLQADRL